MKTLKQIGSKTVLALALLICGLSGPGRAQSADPMDLTREADHALASGNKPQARALLNQAIERYAHHPLRPYWVHQLAQTQGPVPLEPGDPLLPHYHWWRAMAQPPNYCSDGFSLYGRLSPLSEVLPSISESTDIEERLHCAEKLPERERLAVARVLDQYRYFWLLPRLLKNVATPEGLWLQGESRMLNRQYKQALLSFQALLKQKQADGLLKKQALIEAGVAERRLGNPKGVQKWWSSIASSDQDFYPEVLWQRAMLAYAADSPVNGQKLLKELISRFPAHRRTPDALETLLR
ncbi:MAG: tol-pal system YbgF family protein, partial [Candidatus Sericytochromatia bacterium]